MAGSTSLLRYLFSRITFGCILVAPLIAPSVVHTQEKPLAPTQTAPPVTANLPPPASQASAPSADVEVMPIDLPTALRLANASNPTIQVAFVRVREAYERQRQAEVAWLPNLQAGPMYNRHDGIVQNAVGNVFPTSKWNFFMGGGAVMDLPLSDALFLPLITRRLTAAEAARARAVTDNVQLDVALTYIDLLDVYGELVVNAEVLAYAEQMLAFAEASREAQFGKTPADVTRARTEVQLRREERLELEGRATEFAARLAQLLLLRPSVDLRPTDPTIVPIALVDVDGRIDELIAIGLLNRPEMAEHRALIAAALAAWRQARVGPLLPRLGASYLSGDFGGGINDSTIRSGGRGDGTVGALWELQNLGAGNVARARERRALYNEQNLHLIEMQAAIGAEVTAAVKNVRVRARALASAQAAVVEAEETWRRLRDAAFGLNGRDRRYDPLEPLIAEQQISLVRTRYLQAIAEYNKTQFRLYTYLGQPTLAALPQATLVPVTVSSVPRVPSKAEMQAPLRLIPLVPQPPAKP
jgi:outer membrane protein TolC